MDNNYFNCQEKLLDFSKKNPEKIAIVYNEQSISYSEFWSMVISLSEELKQLGVEKRDFIALIMSNSIEMVVSLFAILNCNAVVVPINIDLPFEQASRIISESNPKMILYNEHTQYEFIYKNITSYCVNYKNIVKDKKSVNDLILFNKKDIAYCIFTSGSSGIPKGVLLTYEGILNHIESKVSLLELTCDNNLCLSFNIGFVASIWQLLAPILLGAQLNLYNNTLIKKPYQFFERIEIDRINTVSMIPQSLYSYCHLIENKKQKLSLQI